MQLMDGLFDSIGIMLKQQGLEYSVGAKVGMQAYYVIKDRHGDILGICVVYPTLVICHHAGAPGIELPLDDPNLAVHIGTAFAAAEAISVANIHGTWGDKKSMASLAALAHVLSETSK